MQACGDTQAELQRFQNEHGTVLQSPLSQQLKLGVLGGAQAFLIRVSFPFFLCLIKARIGEKGSVPQIQCSTSQRHRSLPPRFSRSAFGRV